MESRKIRPGNPSNLTLKQHVLPVGTIRRFLATDGKVEVQRRPPKTAVRFRATPADGVFWVERAWDQPSEDLYKRTIEDPFQALTDQIVAGKRRFDPTDRRLVTNFLWLWQLRFRLQHSPQPAVKSRIDLKQVPLSQAQQDRLEKNGLYFAVDNGFSAQQAAGLRMRVDLIELNRRCPAESVPWTVVTSTGKEFLVPDTTGEHRAIPVTPHHLLYPGLVGTAANDADVVKVNKAHIASARSYYFARDFGRCF